MYTTLKTIHVCTVVLTFLSFATRGIWLATGSNTLQHRWVKIAPHVIDGMLLASAVGLIIQVHQYPGTHAWLTAKVLAVVIYIVLGSVALRRGRTQRIRLTAWLAALATFFYIVAVALTRNPFPFTSYI